MTDGHVQKYEHEAVSVFSLSQLPEAEQALVAPKYPLALLPTSRPTTDVIERLLGTRGLNVEVMELFQIKDLKGVGLFDYIVDYLGVPADEVAKDRPRLDALDGYVMVVLSKAFQGAAIDLHPAVELTLIGSYRVTRINWCPGTDPSVRDIAKPFSGPSTNPRARRERATRLGGIIVAIVLILFALLVLWVVL
ncbi:MAG: hypothetical protein GDA36_13730 [Rhodobacteraceae bacterium]|nr:hypothetical protein [Paracoccaceae bacterium]